MQFSFIEDYIRDSDFALKKPVTLLAANECSQRLDRVRKRIHGVCKGLLSLRHRFFLGNEVTRKIGPLQDTVVFTHRSIVEFLESEAVRQTMKPELQHFEPVDAHFQTYLALLKNIDLPRRYFFKGYRHRGTLLVHCLGFEVLSLAKDLKDRILLYRDLGMKGGSKRLCHSLDVLHHTILSIPGNLARTTFSLTQNVICQPADLPLLLCAELSIFEYISHVVEISPNSTTKCIDLCVGSFYWSKSSTAVSKAFKTLETLFIRGGSPEEISPLTKPSTFYILLFHWFAVLHATPYLPLLAFMLYQGVNPRFTIIFSRTKYEITDIPGYRDFFKACCTIDRPSLGVIQKMERMRIGSLAARADSRLCELLSAHDHKLDLRTSVHIWFPDYGKILQEVIDWILDLGVLVDVDRRSQLQSKFGDHLRPLFDEQHPSFIGFDPSQTLESPIDMLNLMFLEPKRKEEHN